MTEAAVDTSGSRRASMSMSRSTMSRSRRPDPLARSIGTLAYMRELRQRQLHCEDLEEAARVELAQAEDMGWHSLLAAMARHRHKTDRRQQQQQEREDTALRQAMRTLERRIDGLIHEESRARATLEHKHALGLDAVLRVLEKDIQDDVDAIQYTDQQRVKYFHKTVAVINRNEHDERREITNGERYEWLVMMQRYDAATLQLRLEEKLRQFREQQKRKLERFQMTTSSADYRRSVRNADARRRARGIAEGKKKKYTGVLPRTEAQLPPEYHERAMQLLGERETEARVSIMADEVRARETIERAFRHRLEIVQEADRKAYIAQQDSDVRAALRHLRDLERDEAAARTMIATEERAKFLGIMRKFTRDVVAEERRLTADVTRQVTHQRKMDDRQQRMLFARTHFVEKQLLLSNATRDSPIEQEIFPAFTPRPPEMLAVQAQMKKLAATARPSSRRERDDELAAETGNLDGLATARQNVAVRSLTAQMHAGRVAIEREERMERYGLATSASQSLGRANGDRITQAHDRRVAEQVAREQQLLERIEGDHLRSTRAQQRQSTRKRALAAIDRIHRDELSARIEIKTAESDWWARFFVYVDAIAGKRIMAAFDGVVDAEAAGRRDVIAAETRLRAALRTSASHHKPQSRVVKVEPLPPPKSKYSYAGAPPRPQPQPPGASGTFGSRSASGVASPRSGTTGGRSKASSRNASAAASASQSRATTRASQRGAPSASNSRSQRPDDNEPTEADEGPAVQEAPRNATPPPRETEAAAAAGPSESDERYSSDDAGTNAQDEDSAADAPASDGAGDARSATPAGSSPATPAGSSPPSRRPTPPAGSSPAASSRRSSRPPSSAAASAAGQPQQAEEATQEAQAASARDDEASASRSQSRSRTPTPPAASHGSGTASDSAAAEQQQEAQQQPETADATEPTGYSDDFGSGDFEDDDS